MTGIELSSRFFVEIGVILAVGALCARVGRRLLQPPVVGEMVAGILLGPSVLGWLAPSLAAWLFPKSLMPVLYAASQVGLALYMFCVGLEFRQEVLAKAWRTSLSVSVFGMLVPMALGSVAGLALRRGPGFFPASVVPWQAAAFGGLAVSITAFPTLARIIVERGLAGTRVGTIALAAGACDDLAAWCLLAVLLALFAGDARIAVIAVGGGAIFCAAAWFVLRPAARRLVERAGPAAFGAEGLAVAVVALMAVSWFTETIRLYAVFGAFVFGAIMPRGAFSERLHARISPLTTALLVPLFFVYTGLNTRVDLLDSTALWLVTAAILAIATVSKGGACALAARAQGYPPAEAAGLGVLMNARGLMELILLDICFSRGLITQTTFTIYVLMAVATTFAAAPLFELFRPHIPGLHARSRAGGELSGI